MRRRFVAIATQRYDGGWSELEGVADEVRAVRAWLCDEALGDRRFEHVLTELAADPGKEAVTRALGDPGQQDWTADDGVFLFVTGHGETDRGRHYLILRGTEQGMLGRTAIATADLVRWLSEHPVVHVVLVLDVCDAGEVMGDVLPISTSWPSTWLVLPSAMKDQKAQTGALSGAIAEFLGELRGPKGRKFGFPDEYVDVGEFIAGVNEHLQPGQTVAPLYPHRPGGVNYCLPNPHWRPSDRLPTEDRRRDLALPRDELRMHWSPRSRGVRTMAERGWLFAGRAALIGKLIDVLRSPPGATVVTGPAGSGKSAVLARLVTLSDGRFRSEHASDVDRIDPALLPPENAVDVAVLATGKLHTAILTQLFAALGVPVPGDADAAPVSHWLGEWHAWLQDAGREVTIVIDALDEASNPRELVREVLAHLQPPEGPLQVRLIIGVRSSQDAQRARREGWMSLADLTARWTDADVLPVDDPEWRADDDIANYVDSILANTPNSRYVSPRQRAEIAEIVGSRAGRSFLFAGIAASSLAQRDEVVAADDPSWLQVMDSGIAGLLRDDLWRSLSDPDEIRRAVLLLRALAFGRGAGLPWRDVWPRVAVAVGGHVAELVDDDIAWLLGSRLAGYLITDREDDVTVYRLFHDELRRTLRDDWRTLLMDPDGDEPEVARDGAAEIRGVEAAVAGELARLAESTIKLGRRVPPYLSRHLAEHALAGGVLDPAHLPDGFLPHLDLTRFREALTRSRESGAALPALPVLRQVAHRWDVDRPAHNACVLEMWAALLGIAFRTPLSEWWQVRWAVQPPDHSTVLGEHSGEVWAVTAVDDPPERALAASGGGDGTVRMWDLITGNKLHVLDGHGAPVLALAAGTWGGRRVVASGDADGLVHVWDVDEGVLIARTANNPSPSVFAVAVAAVDDTTVVISGAEDGKLRHWTLNGPGDLVPRGAAVDAHHGPIHAMTTLRLATGTRLITGGRDGQVCAWDVRTGRRAEPPLSTSIPVRSLAALRLADDQLIVVSGGDHGEIGYWNVARGTQRRQLRDSGGAVRALVIGRMDDLRQVVVSVQGSVLRVREADSGRGVGDVFRGPSGSLMAAAYAQLPDGRSTVITGDRDAAVRQWDLAGRVATTGPSVSVAVVDAVATGTLPDGRDVLVSTVEAAHVDVRVLTTGDRLAPPLPCPRGSAVVKIGTVPLGRSGFVVVAGTFDGRVVGWNLLADGARLRTEGDPHDGPVQAVATLTAADGRALAVSAGWDRRVVLWELSGESMVATELGAHDQPVLAAGAFRSGSTGARVVTADEGGLLRVWDVGRRREVSSFAVGPPRTDGFCAITAVAAVTLPDGRAAAVCGTRAGALTAIDLVNGEQLFHDGAAHPGGVVGLAAARLPNGSSVLLSSGDESSVHVRTLPSGEVRGEPLPVAGKVRAMAVLDTVEPLVAVAGAGIAVAALRLRPPETGPARSPSTIDARGSGGEMGSDGT